MAGYGIEGNSFSGMQNKFQSIATGTYGSINPGSTTKTKTQAGPMDALGGAAGGALVGFEIAGGWGAVAGGLLGLASSFF